MPDPSLTSLDPDTVPVGWQGELIVYGKDFGRKDYVFLGGHLLPTSFVSSNELRAEVDDDRTSEVGAFPVKVHGDSSGVSNELEFTVESA